MGRPKLARQGGFPSSPESHGLELSHPFHVLLFHRMSVHVPATQAKNRHARAAKGLDSLVICHSENHRSFSPTGLAFGSKAVCVAPRIRGYSRSIALGSGESRN